MRRVAPILCALAALALTASAGAGVLPEPPQAELKTSGNDSELVRSVPIASKPLTQPRTVMSLGPDKLPRLESGDNLRFSAEVQVSTTCVARGPRCVGRRYEFNPTIVAQLRLSPSQEPATGVPLSDQRQVLCKQRRPNRNHHCTLAFPNANFAVSDPAALPCPANACFVNLELSASHRKARRGNRVVLGADRPDGGIVQDKGRLNVVHARSGVAPPSEQATGELVNDSLPLTEGKKEKRRVIHSIPIAAPLKGEVLAFDGSYRTVVDHLPYNVFLSSRVILAEEPTATDPTGLAKSAVQLRGQATETNGFNCTQGPSGYPTPCTSLKAGAIRITRDAVDGETGLPATLYLNLVGAAKPLLSEKVKRGQQAFVEPASGLTVARYAAG
jgi:hypothetical protein